MVAYTDGVDGLKPSTQETSDNKQGNLIQPNFSRRRSSATSVQHLFPVLLSTVRLVQATLDVWIVNSNSIYIQTQIYTQHNSPEETDYDGGHLLLEKNHS